MEKQVFKKQDGCSGNKKTKCGFVALIGATNSGKSTLLNTIMATKISITSHKVQTTRNQIRGIKTNNNIQMVKNLKRPIKN